MYVNERYTPKLLTDNVIICMAIDYLIGDKAVVSSIANKYNMSVTTTWRYLHYVGHVDMRLYQYVKEKLFKNRENPGSFYLKKNIRDHLKRIGRNLAKRKTCPENLSYFIWESTT